MVDILGSRDCVSCSEPAIVKLLMERSNATNAEERAAAREKYLSMRLRIVRENEILATALDGFFEVVPEKTPKKSASARIGEWIQRTLFYFGP